MEKKYRFILVLPSGEKFVMKKENSLFLKQLGNDVEGMLLRLANVFAEASYMTIPVEPCAAGVISREWVMLWGDKLQNSHVEVREMT